MTDVSARIALMKKMHLFSGLKDDEVKSIAESLNVKSDYQDDEVVFEQDKTADIFYIIFKGKVNIYRKGKKEEERIAFLGAGDYFGEEALLTNRLRSATVRATAGTILLSLRKEQFAKLIKTIKSLKTNFQIAVESRKLTRRLHPGWLNANEVIYLLTRKHPILLLRVLWKPVLSFLIPLALMTLAAFDLSNWFFGILAGMSLIFCSAWTAWEVIDWGNDYYIVTNQRVIWLEKVIGLYDSREEAMMNTVLSINTSTDQWGRIVGYGDVIVRTFTGEIRLKFVGYPKQVEMMIREYWTRTQGATKEIQQETVKKAIRKKLGWPDPPAAKQDTFGGQQKHEDHTFFADWFSGRFTLRLEDGDTVTYHKHWIILLFTLWKQFLILIALVAFPFVWNYFELGTMPIAMITFLISFILVTFIWIWYDYADWSNDIFQVTADQIIDVFKKPFGDEERKAAPLENILSTQYKRHGIVGMVMNFGTVFIAVGGTNFDFEDVADPPTVQQDIVRRMNARKAKKAEAEAAAEREKLAEWLMLYHKTVVEHDEFIKQQAKKEDAEGQ
jgi:hypothetical protein